MSNMNFNVPTPTNEPVLEYKKGSKERRELEKKITELSCKVMEIPLVIGGKEVKTGVLGEIRAPHDHQHLLARFHMASENEVNLAVEAARNSSGDWARMPWQERMAIFLRAAELTAGPWRSTINATTMLGQSKNAYQAEIDAACEMIDFFRFNARFAEIIYGEQPKSSPGIWNRMEYRELEGFVFAVSPFNFTAIAGNLIASPAMMGNVVLWKPASTAVYSNWIIMQILQEAGLPSGVINFLPGSGAVVGDAVLKQPELAGIHFTGSTRVFHQMWETVGKNISKYHCYPRLVGETGGKDFIFVHPSANAKQVTTAMIRGAFEYQGQKCSAASRAYIPETLWQEIKPQLLAELSQVNMGDVANFTNFVNAVIDKRAYKTITEYIDFAKESSEAEIIAGGNYNDETGWFIEPTVILTTNPKFRTMEEEIFGPVLTIYIYPDQQFEETLEICDQTSPYALTGAIFATDRQAVMVAMDKLRHAAGNFYVNDKPTGAVVGQQPFGGARASGTNDKAGSHLNLHRWVSPRTIKETLNPPSNWRYPFLEE